MNSDHAIHAISRCFIGRNPGKAPFKSCLSRQNVHSQINEVEEKDLALLYDCRWFVEISLKSIKETMRMDILRAKTPQMVRKEIWAHLLAYNLIRKIIAESASRYDKNPRCLSFKCALQFIDAFCRSGYLSQATQAYEYLLKAIAHKTVGNRPGRYEPRMTKRRPKAFPRLQKPRSFYHKKAS
jgi:hypothetical protein